MTIVETNYLEHEFTSTGVSSSFQIYKSPYNYSLSGTFVATIMLQRSFDKGATWVDIKAYSIPKEKIGDEPELGLYYRFNCTSYTSGTAICRLGSYYNVGI